ncbi:MAG: hypothetical protein R3C14_05745 [Caldilineaceae bacterium]
MQINLTHDEYRQLIDMLYMAQWMLTAHKVGDDPRVEPYKTIEQKFYALATAMSADHLIEFASEFDQFFPTREFETETSVHSFIDEYDDETFWDELTRRLAERDLLQQLGGRANFLKLSTEERFRRLSQLESTYAKEFAQSGIENLYIKEAGSGPQWRKPTRNR